MSRKTSRLTLDNLGALPSPCRSCLFWELDPVRRARVCPDEAYDEKEGWEELERFHVRVTSAAEEKFPHVCLCCL